VDSLLTLADRVAAAALDSGALVSIPTFVRPMTDHGTEFSVRVVGQLTRKATAGAGPASSNPFLPYEAALHVTDLPPRHVCLLNKFNVVERHLLVITREYSSQLGPLDADDFTALAFCLAAGDGLGFYNGGPAAGASQRHKHLQWIPVPPRDLPLAAQLDKRCDTQIDMPCDTPCDTQCDTPCDTQSDTQSDTQCKPSAESLVAHRVEARIDREPTWPFRHAVAHFNRRVLSCLGRRTEDGSGDLSTEWAIRVGAELEHCYRRLLDDCGLVESSCELPPYNLIVTRRWMLLVPRRCEHAAGISFNALAFAGALLVKDLQQWESLRSFGPWRALRSVAFESGPSGVETRRDPLGTVPPPERKTSE